LTWENMTTRWRFPWADWLQRTFPAERKKSLAKEIRLSLREIVKRLAVFDIQRQGSVIMKSKLGFVESHAFIVQMLKYLFDYFESNPCLSPSFASEFIRALPVI